MNLNAGHRLIVAADYSAAKCGGRRGVQSQVIGLADALDETGVVIKVNSALRSAGYNLIEAFHTRMVLTMADLKLDDIPETLKLDGELIAEAKPALLTVKCSAGRKAIRQLRDAMPPEIKILGVTVLTSFDEESWISMNPGLNIGNSVLRFADEAAEGGADGLVLSGRELQYLRCEDHGFSEIVIPAIRPTWSWVKGDDQKRPVTPTAAFQQGATRIVVGRPVTGASPNTEGRPENPREAVKWILEEIKEIKQALSA